MFLLIFWYLHPFPIDQRLRSLALSLGPLMSRPERSAHHLNLKRWKRDPSVSWTTLKPSKRPNTKIACTKGCSPWRTKSHWYSLVVFNNGCYISMRSPCHSQKKQTLCWWHLTSWCSCGCETIDGRRSLEFQGLKKNNKFLSVKIKNSHKGVHARFLYQKLYPILPLHLPW